MTLKQQIRKFFYQRIMASMVTNAADYEEKVNKRIYYRFKVYEQAIINRYKPDQTEDEINASASAAIEARAELYDDMREYLLVDLTNTDENLPTRPAHYEVKEITLTNGDEVTTTQQLVKVTSSEIPKLNYPLPFWQGLTREQIKERFYNALKP